MVGSTSSPRSFALSVAVADAGSAGILKGPGGAASYALVPRRNGWTSRAVRSSSGRIRAHHVHPDLMPVHNPPVIVGGDNSNGSTTDGLSPASDSDSSPSSAAAHPAPPTATATPRAPPSSVPVLAITCGAVGGIIALAVVLALIYVRRVRRRVKRMKRLTNVLGPELAPMSPSHLSHLSTIESPRVKFDLDGKPVLSPRTMSELANHLPTPSIPSASSPSSVELPGIIPLSPIRMSPIRTSTIILSPPPAAKRSSTRSSNPNLYSNPRSPTYASRAAAVPWPLITALSLSNDHPQHELQRTGEEP